MAIILTLEDKLLFLNKRQIYGANKKSDNLELSDMAEDWRSYRGLVPSFKRKTNLKALHLRVLELKVDEIGPVVLEKDRII